MHERKDLPPLINQDIWEVHVLLKNNSESTVLSKERSVHIRARSAKERIERKGKKTT